MTGYFIINRETMEKFNVGAISKVAEAVNTAKNQPGQFEVVGSANDLLERFTVPQLTTLYNNNLLGGKKPLKKFDDKISASTRTWAAVSGKESKASSPQPAAKKAGEESLNSASKKTGGTSRKRFSSEAVITVLAESNPRKGKAGANFALYSKCKTVGDYYEAGGIGGYLKPDTAAGYIKVQEPGAEETPAE
tara:strand:+ start:401 stop:976 length:576 start_codon:yes stop_codon:yes gene_type:complete